MKLYTVGFVFDSTREQVLLIHKQKPEWQRGKINGIGGKVEAGEAAADCIARECREETTLNIPATQWQYFATITEKQSGNESKIDVFATTYGGPKTDAIKGDHEEVGWFCYDKLPENSLSNLTFLVPMARQQLLGHGLKEVVIKY